MATVKPPNIRRLMERRAKVGATPDRGRVERLMADDAAREKRRVVVAKYARRFPPNLMSRDEIEQAALVGMWKAALRFDESRGVRFASHCYRRMRGEIIDEFRRAAGRGLMRAWRPDRHAPIFVDSFDADGGPSAEPIESGDDPVGWELEWQDEIEGMGRRMTGPEAAVMRKAYLEPGMPVTAGEARAEFLHALAVGRLRRAMTNGEEDQHP